MRTHTGGCHCGRVRFEVVAPQHIEVLECDCSICKKYAYLHLIVDASRFKLLTDRAALITYTFNSGVAKHHFCATCGVKSFYVPRSHPHGVSVNARCLDEGSVASITASAFDGANWEKAMANYLGDPRV